MSLSHFIKFYDIRFIIVPLFYSLKWYGNILKMDILDIVFR